MWNVAERSSMRPGAGPYWRGIAAVRRRGDALRADQEGAEALARPPLGRVGAEQRIEGGNDGVVLEILGVELRQTRAVKAAPR